MTMEGGGGDRGVDWLQRSSDVMPIAAVSHLRKRVHVSTLTVIIYPPQINNPAGFCTTIASVLSLHPIKTMKTNRLHLSDHLIRDTQ